MRNNESGEFELVVGNRQLLSGFFIVVLLFAVAFAMGYVVGQNSPRSVRAQAETASAAPVSLTPSDSRPQPAAPATPPPAAPAAEPPAADAGAPAAESTPPAPQAATPPPAAETPASEAPAGSYWQVMAVPQADAEVVVQALKDKGFPTSLSPGPNNLVRVLVGPYKDTQSMGKAKTELENAGFRPFRK